MKKLTIALFFAAFAAHAQVSGPGPVGSAPGGPQLPLSVFNGGTAYSPLMLPHWRAAVAEVRACGAGSTFEATACASFANPRVLFIGDSTWFGGDSEGDFIIPNSSDWLATDLTNAGIPANDNSICGGSTVSGDGERAGRDPRVSIGSWVENLLTTGTLGGAIFQTTATGTAMVYTPGTSVNAFNIWYSEFSGAGTFSATATGGTADSIAAANSTTTVAMATVTTATPSASNSLTLNNTSGGTNYVECIEAYNNTTKNVDIINAGWWGSTSSVDAVSGAAFNTLPMIGTVAPTLIVFEQGINDWEESVPVTTTIANMQAVITKAKAVSADIILVTGAPDATNTTLEAQQISAMQALALKNNIPLIDINTRWVSYAAGNALGDYIDTIHPNSVGHYDIAESISKMLISP